MVIAQEIFGVNRHIRARGRRLRRGRLRDHRTLFVRSHPPRHRARLQRSGNPAGPRLPAADSRRTRRSLDLTRLHQRDQTRRRASSMVGYCWGGTLALPRGLRTAGVLRGVLLRRADQGSPREIAAPAGACTTSAKGIRTFRLRHREDPRRRPERRVSSLSGRPRIQLRRARHATTRPARSSRASARSQFLAAANGDANDQAQGSSACGKSAPSSTASGCPPIRAQTTEIRNPANGELLGTVPHHGRRARRAAPSRPRTPPCPPGRRRPPANARRSCGAGSTSCSRTSTISPSS